MMKKLVLLLVLVSISSIGMAQRPKVGLVLGGGGAKGAAHVGVLKVLEEAGIPIDYIAADAILDRIVHTAIRFERKESV